MTENVEGFDLRISIVEGQYANHHYPFFIEIHTFFMSENALPFLL